MNKKSCFNLFSEDTINQSRFKVTQDEVKTQLSTSVSFEFTENKESVTNIVSRLLEVDTLQSSITLLSNKIIENESIFSSINNSLGTKIIDDKINFMSINNSLSNRINNLESLFISILL